MLKIEKIKDEIKNYDMVNFGEDLQCYLSQITTNQNYDDTCYRIGIDCSDCLKLSLMDLLEEYKEPVKLTMLEYGLLKLAKKDEYNFIARDEDGRLFLYANIPWKHITTWNYSGKNIILLTDLFKFVKWEDEDPWNIDNILANCEVIEDDI